MDERKPKVVVIGGGISGLAAAWLIGEELAQAFPGGGDVIVLEKEDRPGGKIWTVADSGFHLEAGPNGFLDSKPWTLELTRRLGLEGDLLRSSDSSRKRYIFHNGRLHRLPENPPAFLKSKLLSWPGKFRILAEYWQKQYHGEEEETLAHFARRRLGEEAYQRLLDPMVSGIFAGNPETMSLHSAFPRIFELERDYGGLFKAMLALSREKRRRGEKSESGPGGPGGVLTSYGSGLDFLTRALAERLGENVRLDLAAEAVRRNGDGFVVRAGGRDIPADAVVSAAPADAAGTYLRELVPEMAAEFLALPYSPMAVVGLGFSEHRLPAPLDGFGFLIPHSEKREILGILWSSSIFPGQRAPEGSALLTVMMGGARRTGITGLSDAEVLTTARREVAHTMGIDTAPEFTRIFRWERAIPQYPVGHWDLRTRVDAVGRAVPGLWIIGNAFQGIGVNDCTAAAFRVASEMSGFLGRGGVESGKI